MLAIVIHPAECLLLRVPQVLAADPSRLGRDEPHEELLGPGPHVGKAAGGLLEDSCFDGFVDHDDPVAGAVLVIKTAEGLTVR